MKNKTIQKLYIVFVLAFVFGVSKDVKADFVFGEPENLGPNINTAQAEGWREGGLSISSDGLSMYFDSYRSGGFGIADIWVVKRATKDDNWSRPTNLGSAVNGSSRDSNPSISADGLSLYFTSNRSGDEDIWITTRVADNTKWGTPVNLGPVINSSAQDYMSYISIDGLSLYFSSNRSGGLGKQDLWMTTRATTDDDWSEPVNLGPSINTSSNDQRMWVSSDGLLLLFQSDRSRSDREHEIYMTTRITINNDWAEPAKLWPSVNLITDVSPIISSDGGTFYFSSFERDGGYGTWDLWQAPIKTIVDLNGDGIVDSADMCIIVDNWGMDNQLCDIGPTPLGDGVVDVEDLVTLSEHLFEDVEDSTLIAYWALDEAEGMFAVDSVGNNNALVVGGAMWQSSGGQIDGALQLDGVSGCAITEPVLNPTDGPFSIITWIKGGASEQVIVSQQATANWLATDAEGNLITELKSSDPLTESLLSESVITEGAWHRIGLVWDGSNRMLYVDGVVVAEDTPSDLVSSNLGLYIGVDKYYAADTFFSGMIDDVRIYNRTIHP